MPDIFISSDTTDITPYLTQAVSKGLIRQYTFRYSDIHRNELAGHKTYEELADYLKKKNILDGFVAFAASKGLKAPQRQIARSRKRLEQTLYSNIIYNTLGMLEHIRYINTFDPVVTKAIEVLESGNAFPQAPADSE